MRFPWPCDYSFPQLGPADLGRAAPLVVTSALAKGHLTGTSVLKQLRLGRLVVLALPSGPPDRRRASIADLWRIGRSAGAQQVTGEIPQSVSITDECPSNFDFQSRWPRAHSLSSRASTNVNFFRRRVGLSPHKNPIPSRDPSRL